MQHYALHFLSVKQMHELGTNKILVCSNVQPTMIHNDDIVAGDLFALGEVAKKHDVQVGYEALAWGHSCRPH